MPVHTRSAPSLGRTVPRCLAEVVSWLDHFAVHAKDSIRRVARALATAQLGSNRIETLSSLGSLDKGLELFLGVEERRRLFRLLANLTLKPISSLLPAHDSAPNISASESVGDTHESGSFSKRLPFMPLRDISIRTIACRNAGINVLSQSAIPRRQVYWWHLNSAAILDEVV